MAPSSTSFARWNPPPPIPNSPDSLSSPIHGFSITKFQGDPEPRRHLSLWPIHSCSPTRPAKNPLSSTGIIYKEALRMWQTPQDGAGTPAIFALRTTRSEYQTEVINAWRKKAGEVVSLGKGVGAGYYFIHDGQQTWACPRWRRGPRVRKSVRNGQEHRPVHPGANRGRWLGPRQAGETPQEDIDQEDDWLSVGSQ